MLTEHRPRWSYAIEAVADLSSSLLADPGKKDQYGSRTRVRTGKLMELPNCVGRLRRDACNIRFCPCLREPALAPPRPRGGEADEPARKQLIPATCAQPHLRVHENSSMPASFIRRREASENVPAVKGTPTS